MRSIFFISLHFIYFQAFFFRIISFLKINFASFGGTSRKCYGARSGPFGTSFWKTGSDKLQSFFSGHFLLCAFIENALINFKMSSNVTPLAIISRAYIEQSSIFLTWVVWLEERMWVTIFITHKKYNKSIIIFSTEEL